MKTRDVVFGLVIGSLALIEGVYFVQKFSRPEKTTHFASWRKEHGKDLDRRFVEALISRYEDTLALAEQERVHGHNAELKKLAAALLVSRRADLDALIHLSTADSGTRPDSASR